MTPEPLGRVVEGDRRLLAKIDAAMEEAARRGGVVCGRGCTECCRGPFEVTALDALRLREGLRRLEKEDPARAARIKERVEADPGDAAEDRMCAALDPESGTCDLYAWRPVTCRTFGPATRTVEGGVAACERCYRGLEDEQVAARAVDVDPDGMEAALLDELESLGCEGASTVAQALKP